MTWIVLRHIRGRQRQLHPRIGAAGSDREDANDEIRRRGVAVRRSRSQLLRSRSQHPSSYHTNLLEGLRSAGRLSRRVSPRLVPLLVLLASMAPLGTIQLLLVASDKNNDGGGREDRDNRRGSGPLTATNPLGVTINEEDVATFASCDPFPIIQETAATPATTTIFPLAECRSGGGCFVGDDDDNDYIRRIVTENDPTASDHLHLHSTPSTSPVASSTPCLASRTRSGSKHDPSFCWKRKPWFFTLHQQRHPFQGGGGVGHLHWAETTTAAAEPLHHHAELLFLWMVLCVFGVILPAVLSLGSCGRARRGRADVPRNPKKQRHQQRLRRAVALFKYRYAKKLTLADFQWVHRTTAVEQGNDSEDRHQLNPRCQMRLPALPVRENDRCGRRLLSDPCAVCLQQYQVGDTVVWSPNDKCRHVYHQRCLLRWLLHQTSDSDFPCAVCRQPYCREMARPSSSVPGRRRIEEKGSSMHASPG